MSNTRADGPPGTGQRAPSGAQRDLKRVLVILDWDPAYPLHVPGMKQEVEQADLILGVQSPWQPAAVIKNEAQANVTMICRASWWPSAVPGPKVLVILDWLRRSRRERSELEADIAAADLVLGVRKPWEAVEEIRNEIGSFVMNAVA